MLEQMVAFFVSGFVYPGILWTQLLLGIGLSIVFGAVWFAPYWTPILKKPWAWAVLASSVLLSWTAVAFIQIPLQFWSGQVLHHFWSQEILMRWLLLAGIPQILLSGLVQEGSKLVPVVIYWWRSGRNIDPKLGLAIGAVAGLGFGVFEAVWAHNMVFASNWSWEAVQTQGLLALAPFWERFFAIAAHIAFSALAGYGLAKGLGVAVLPPGRLPARLLELQHCFVTNRAYYNHSTGNICRGVGCAGNRWSPLASLEKARRIS